MIKFGISNEIIASLKHLIKLDSDEAHLLSNIIADSKIGEGPAEIAESNYPKFKSSTEDEFFGIIASLFGMVNIFSESNNEIEEFIQEFIESVKYKSELNSSEESVLKKYLSQLLQSFNHIKLTVKARDLFVSNQNNYTGARIISDIRIVYDDEGKLERKEQCALIVHQLKINMMSNGHNKEKELYLSFNLAELEELREIIDRAIAKDELIRNNNHSLQFIDVN